MKSRLGSRSRQRGTTERSHANGVAFASGEIVTMRDGELSVTYRQPFDLIVKTAVSAREETETTAVGVASSDRFDNWYPWGDSNARIRLRRPALYPLSYRGTRGTPL